MGFVRHVCIARGMPSATSTIATSVRAEDRFQPTPPPHTTRPLCMDNHPGPHVRNSYCYWGSRRVPRNHRGVVRPGMPSTDTILIQLMCEFYKQHLHLHLHLGLRKLINSLLGRFIIFFPGRWPPLRTVQQHACWACAQKKTRAV